MSNIEPVNKKTAVKNSIWKLLESFLSKGISMIVTIVIARLLLPEAYGVIALTNVYIHLSDILIQAGFSTALIRKKNVTNDDYSTVLGLSLLSAIFLYSLIFVLSPTIANIYETPVLSPVLRVVSISLFSQAFGAVRTSVITREMKFKVLFICTVISNIISGLIGITIAITNATVWALVAQQLSQQFILTIALYIAIKIHISLKISRQSIKELLKPSMKILTSSFLSFAGDSLFSLAIGKVYSLEQLGYYEKGGQLPRQFSLYTFSAVSSVFLPIFASYQDDNNKLNDVFSRVISVSCYVIFPLMAFLSMTATPVITLLLTEKWLPAVPILRWSCLYYLATPILLAHVQLHFAIGKNETRIKAEIFRIVLMLIAFAILFYFNASIIVITAALSIIQFIVVLFITYETKKATGYKVISSIKDLVPTLISTILMCIAVFFISRLNIGVLVLLIIETLVGMIVYFSSSLFLKNKALSEFLHIIRISK